MSEVKTNKLTAATGTAITLGDSGDTFTVPSGAEIDIASGATLDVNGTIDVTGATVTGLSVGKVLQVVTQTSSTMLNTTSNSFQSTSSSIQVSLTTSQANPKIWIVWSGYIHRGGSHIIITDYARSVDSGTYTENISGYTTGLIQHNSGDNMIYVTYTLLDSPTVSSGGTVAYRPSFRNTNNSTTVYFNHSDSLGSFTIMEVGT